MVERHAALRRRAGSATRSTGRPPTASPTGGWFLDDAEIGLPFLERVRASGTRVVAVHKGLGGPIPAASVAAASPRDIGPAAVAFPDLAFLVYHSGYERDPEGEEGPFDPVAERRRPPGREPRRRRCRPRRQRLRGARQHLVPDAAATDRGRARARQAAVAVGPDASSGAPTRSGTGHPAADRRVPHVQDPERMQEEFGYPPLTAETKAKILGVNARAVYGITARRRPARAADRIGWWCCARGSPPRSPRRLRPDRPSGAWVTRQHAVGEAVLAAPGLRQVEPELVVGLLRHAVEEGESLFPQRRRRAR